MVDLSDGKILIIDDIQNEDLQILISMLTDREIDTYIENDLGLAIQRVQVERFDALVLDAEVSAMPIERTIHILKNIDPNLKIIIKTRENSKELEAKVRQASIYYFHLESFGWDDLCLAVESAVGQKELIGKRKEQDQKLVYIVDEDDTFIEIHKTNLQRHNFQVEIFFDADKAIDAIKQKTPDIIILDIDIPVGSDGKHFLEKMVECKDDRIVRVPMLLYVSRENYGRYVKVLDALEPSLLTYSLLEKPVKIENVIPEIQQLMMRKNSIEVT